MKPLQFFITPSHLCFSLCLCLRTALRHLLVQDAQLLPCPCLARCQLPLVSLPLLDLCSACPCYLIACLRLSFLNLLTQIHVKLMLACLKIFRKFLEPINRITPHLLFLLGRAAGELLFRKLCKQSGFLLGGFHHSRGVLRFPFVQDVANAAPYFHCLAPAYHGVCPLTLVHHKSIAGRWALLTTNTVDTMESSTAASWHQVWTIHLVVAKGMTMQRAWVSTIQDGIATAFATCSTCDKLLQLLRRAQRTWIQKLPVALTFDRQALINAAALPKESK
mmetsp:Transcript_154274/g.280226  ORF Transcript_154274/g.280226 Transcript_154274/m.280226 type:complete len:277 (+) Transcript_154274:932-1762(+)